MLKTHLKPIVNYFFQSGIDSESVNSTPAKKDSHLQAVIEYFVEVDPTDPGHTPQPKLSKVAAFFSNLWRTILTVDTDPQIKQRFDRSGHEYWQAYDPLTDKHYAFDSEDDVYYWLERRYYE